MIKGKQSNNATNLRIYVIFCLQKCELNFFNNALRDFFQSMDPAIFFKLLHIWIYPIILWVNVCYFLQTYFTKLENFHILRDIWIILYFNCYVTFPTCPFQINVDVFWTMHISTISFFSDLAPVKKKVNVAYSFVSRKKECRYIFLNLLIRQLQL